MKETVDLVVVGGGSTATSFLAQLITLLEKTQLEANFHIVVFEPSASLGIGEPYAADLSTNLLNIPAGRMSAYAEDRRDFFCWLEKQSKDYLEGHGVFDFNTGSYLPRPLFGDYLREVWRNTARRAQQCGVTIQHRQAAVTDIARDPQTDGLTVFTHIDCVAAHRVVLCNGNLPSTAYSELQGVQGYFHTPYPAKRVVADIQSHASVGIIGTSLSAIDAIVSLKESGHCGPIYAVSRSGRLPSVRATVSPPTPITAPTAGDIEASVSDPAAGLTLEDLFAFLCHRVKLAGGAIDLVDMLGCDSEIQDSLDREIHASATSARVWQGVAISLNETIEHAWRLMREKERRRLYSDWRATWMIRRATFPMDNAVKIKRYLESKDLQILAGGDAMSVTMGRDSGFDLYTQGFERPRVQNVDYLINATGMSTDVTRTQDPLVRSLLQKGMAVPDAYGGFRLDFDTYALIGARGNIQRDITVLGSLCVGTYFWTMSLDVNARLAFMLAQRMAKELALIPNI